MTKTTTANKTKTTIFQLVLTNAATGQVLGAWVTENGRAKTATADDSPFAALMDADVLGHVVEGELDRTLSANVEDHGV
jgi:hypothetical protein